MPKNNLFDVFRSCEGLSKLYRKKKLDHIIAKFENYINTSSYLGGSKCSTFLLPNKKEVLKITLRDIRYFREGYSRAFQKSSKNSLNLDPVKFFQQQINSMGNYFAQIKEILYSDEDVFVFLQDYCTPFKELPSPVNPQIILQVVQSIHYMISNNVLITEIGPSNIGLSESGKILIYDYDALRPLKDAMAQKPTDWCGHQLGSLLYYLSHIYQPEKINWYRSQRHKWSYQLKSFKDTQKDFPSGVYEVIKAYTIFDKNIETQIEKIIYTLELCLMQIAEKFSITPNVAIPSQVIPSPQILTSSRALSPSKTYKSSQKSLRLSIKPHTIKKLETPLITETEINPSQSSTQKIVYKFRPKMIMPLTKQPTREQVCQLRLKYFEKKIANKSPSKEIPQIQKEIPEVQKEILKKIPEDPKSPHENDLVIIIPSHAIKTENINKDSIIVKWVETEKPNEVL